MPSSRRVGHHPLVILTAIVLLLGFSAALLVSVIAPVNGYEESIYASTPWWYWVMAGITAITGLIVLLHAMKSRARSTGSLILAGIASLLLFRLLITLLPLFRGYFTWAGDNLSNLGHVLDILNSGGIGVQNPYPAGHILVAQTALLTGIPITTIAMLLTGMFSVVFVLGVYLLARAVFVRRSDQIVAVLIASLIFFNDYEVFFRTNAWAFLLVPLILVLFIKSRSSRPHTLMLIPVVLGLSFMHPMAALALAISFIVIAAVDRYRTGRSPTRPAERSLSSAVIPSIIIVIVVLPWTLAFQGFQRGLRELVALILEGGEGTPAASLASTLARLDLVGADVIFLYLRWFGEETILFALAMIGIVLVFRRGKWLFSGRTRPLSRYLGISAIVILSAAAFVVYFLGVAPGLHLLGMERSQRYLVLLLPIVATPLVVYLIRDKNRRSYAAIVVLVLLTASSVSVAGLFHSPWIMRPNAQVSVAEMAGVAWLFETKDEDVRIATILLPTHRFAHLLYGVEGARNRPGQFGTIFIPDNFGYGFQISISGLFAGPTYVMVAESEKVAYLKIWQSAGRFDAESFNRLDSDISLQKIYANGEINVYVSGDP